MSKAILVMAAVLVAQLATAKTIIINPEAKENSKPYSLDILNSDLSETVVRFRMNRIEADELMIEGKTFVRVTLDGATNTNEKGYPSVPKFRKNIMIPAGSSPELNISHINMSKIDLGVVAPAKGTILRNQNPSDIPFVFSRWYKGKSAAPLFPAAPIRLGKTFSMREARGINVEINPVRYNSSTGRTEVIKDLIFTIKTADSVIGNDSIMAMNFRGPHIATFANMYRNTFLNANHYFDSETIYVDGDEHEVSEAGDLLILSHDDFTEGLTEFVEWKKQMGYSTELVALSELGEDPDAEAIKKYIQEKYDNGKSLAFVILVGDAEFVPFYPGTAGNARRNEADPMYGLTEGDDMYPDVIIARFSVKTMSELANIVNRTMSYEKNPTSGDWYGKAIGIASNEGNPTDAVRADWLKEELTGAMYTQVGDHYDPGASASAISDSVNEGLSLINYIGHGSQTAWATGRFYNRHVRDLKNSGNLPMIISVACVNGDFNYTGGDSFAEAWMKAGTPADPRGAIAIFASSTNQSWVPPTIGQLKITKMIAAESMNTVGGLMMNGSVAVLEDGDYTAEQTFQTWHIFGDPTVNLRTRAPASIDVILPTTIQAGVWLRNLDLGEEGLRITVVKNDKLVANGISDETGLVQFHHLISRELDGEATVTISGVNRTPRVVKVNFQ